MVAERTRELDAQKRFVEVVLETLPLGVFVLDAELCVVRANREGARALGCDPGKRAPLAALFGPGKTRVVEAFLREAFETRRGGSIEAEIARAGETKIFRLTSAPFEALEERITHAVVLVEDITRAKRLERQMLLTERLTTAGRLGAGVAHELNNPLATIAGCAESLRERLTEGGRAKTLELADFPHYLGLIEEEAFRCKEITGTLLQLVRDPGSRRAPTDLNALVLKATELLFHQPRFAEGRFVTELDQALPAVAVNEGQIRQVFIALASNALEAMEGRGRLTVRSRLHRGEVEVEFEDEGPGVPDEVLPRIFDPFFTTKPPGQGTGLGLAIAQGIVMTGFQEVSTAVEAMKLGAYDYLTKPMKIEELDVLIRKAAEKAQLLRDNEALRAYAPGAEPFGGILTKSPQMQEVLRIIERIAPTDSSVLVLGASGTGKELVARAIHERSARAGRPFVPIHCGALPREVFESELFGHEKGAFTGAVGAKPGLVELADGGTLLLDEIGEMEPDSQVKLLRALETGTFFRVGATRPRRVDVRLVAATNRDLAEAMKTGEFRQDLYFRINTIMIKLPPLRERREDIALLANHFVVANPTYGAKRLGPRALAVLEGYAWPGNVRG